MNGHSEDREQPTSASSASSTGSISLTHRHERSLRTHFVHSIIRPFRYFILKPGDPWPAGSPKLTPYKSASKTCSINERQVASIYVYDLEPRKSRTTTSKATTNAAAAHTSSGIKRRIYYIAGGSWKKPPSIEHWQIAAKMASAVPNTAVSVISVPLAPKETAPTAFPKLLAMYEVVMNESRERGERVIWAGDSSGANIVLGLVGEALRVGRPGPNNTMREKLTRPLPAPDALFLICPSVDAKRENPDIAKIQKLDPVLKADVSKKFAIAWSGEWSVDDERISPALDGREDIADHVVQLIKERGVVVHGVTAGYDILSPDGIKLRERLEKEGVPGKWLHWDKQMHCFPLAWIYGLPESKEGLFWILDVLGEEG
ncbi:alpha/beta hydrolase fold-domain-containing protein [Phyllosticta capitalensis]|uniref:Alpha/beta hydrolase fold-domain-containing protein n=1 Tax=Phyllosticta capitalensis TaxID=121624 RepID=A0ABR1YGT9_9PEZI